MRILNVEANNILCFETVRLEKLSTTVLVSGPNNSGKSSLISFLYGCLSGKANPLDFRRYASDHVPTLTVDLVLDKGERIFCTVTCPENNKSLRVHFDHETGLYRCISDFYDTNRRGLGEPTLRDCACVLLTSARRLQSYSAESGAQAIDLHDGTLKNVNPLVDHALGYSNTSRELFIHGAKEILGLDIVCEAVDGGRKAGVRLAGGEIRPLEDLGGGVAHVLWLVAAVASLDGKVFFVEEPENDIHPSALKKLCRFMQDNQRNNQYFVSTHSHLVLRFLASDTASVIEISRDSAEGISTANLLETNEERLTLLQTLGYSLSDYDLHCAWLLLEESSMESLIRRFLLPMFCPNLQGKLRTVSARGETNVPASFEDFHRLMVYARLSPIYYQRCWVAIDAGNRGAGIIEGIRKDHPDFPADRLFQWSQEKAERYFPKCFQDEFTSEIEAVAGSKQERYARKSAFYLKVFSWLDEDYDRAKVELESSASELIEKLREIEEFVRKLEP